MTSHISPTFATVLCLVACSQICHAGQLGSVREKLRNEPVKSDAKEQKNRQGIDESSKTSKHSSKKSILNAVSQVIRGQQENSRSRHRQKPARHRHRQPSRSPLSVGMHFVDSTPAPCTIVTEHHYHEPPVVIASSTYESPIPNVPPPPPSPPTLPSVPQAEYATSVAHVPTQVISTGEPIQFLEPWHTRFSIQYASDTDDLSQFGFDFLTNQTGGLGIQTGINLHREKGFDFRDHLWLGDFNIVYELFPTENLRTRAGIGVNWLADPYGAEAGLNLTLGADARLFSNVLLSGEVDFGTLGDADFFHARTTIGITSHEVIEYFAGYDYVDIGGAKIDGIIAGLRFRF